MFIQIRAKRNNHYLSIKNCINKIRTSAVYTLDLVSLETQKKQNFRPSKKNNANSIDI